MIRLARVADLVGRHVEGDRLEHPQLELGGEVADDAERAEERHVGGDRARTARRRRLRQAGHLGQDRHRLLGADDRDRDDRHARPHGDLDEAAPTEPAQPVPLVVGLARSLGALGEHERELALLAQQPVGVVGVGDHAAVAGPQGADDRQRP